MQQIVHEKQSKKTDGLLKTAWIIAIIIIISKIIGFLRDVVIAKCYGTSMVSDAYFYAYQIPSLALVLLGGVGGPFHSAVVSVFAKIAPMEEQPSVFIKKLFNSFVTATFLICLVLSVLVFMFSDVICNVIISSGDPKLVHLASIHLKIMSPILVIGGLVGIYYGILVTYKQFLIPNVSPALASLVIIIFLLSLKTDSSGYILAFATTIGAFLQFAIQLPKAFKIGYKFKPTLSMVASKEYKPLLELLFPSILSSTIGQIYIYVDMFFASSLQEGAWTAIGYANRVFQFPVGILVTAFLVPLFPIFSKLVSEKKFDQIRIYFNKGIGMLNFAAFPVLAGILLMGYDAITLLFQRGAFDSTATLYVTQALIFLSISIIPYIFRDSLTRVYFAFNDSKTPFLIALSSVFLKILLNFIFINKLGIAAITLSTSLVTLINSVLLSIFINKKIKMDYSIYIKETSKMFISAFIAFSTTYFIYPFVKFPSENNIFLLFKILILFTTLCVVYLLFTMLFKIEYGKELILRIMQKVKR